MCESRTWKAAPSSPGVRSFMTPLVQLLVRRGWPSVLGVTAGCSAAPSAPSAPAAMHMVEPVEAGASRAGSSAVEGGALAWGATRLIVELPVGSTCPAGYAEEHDHPQVVVCERRCRTAYDCPRDGSLPVSCLPSVHASGMTCQEELLR
jgi:hypothetical protein